MKPIIRYLFFTFLKIGATSWGGYMALIAVVQKQMSERDNVIDQEEVMRAVSLAAVLPGPMAVNVVAYIGYKLNRLQGAIVSMTGVLLPSFLFMIALSYIYFGYGNIPAFSHFFAGVLPAVAAVIANVAFSMGQKNIKDIPQVLIAILAVTAVIFSQAAYTTISIIAASGIAGYFIYKKEATTRVTTKKFSLSKRNKKRLAVYLGIIVLLMAATDFFYIKLAGQNATLRLYKDIALTFSGLSISQFGGGYVVVPTMQKLIVDTLHWLSLQQFADAIAMGQITPGPIYISAVFIGYKLSGIAGAVIATIAIFLPAGMLMLICARFMNSIAASPVVVAAFRGIGAAVTGLIAAAAFTILYKAHIAVLPLLLIFFITLFILIKYKLTPVYLIPLAGIAGLLIF